MRINKFPGLVQAASPYGLPPGTAVEQNNVMSLVPGQLTVRGGSKKLADSFSRMVEMWGYSIGSGKSEVILAQSETGEIYEFANIGNNGAATKKNSGEFSGDHPVTFSQGRRGEVYIYQGYGKRGLIRGVDGSVRRVGVDAPPEKPQIAIDSTPSYYVARVDITDPGNGYHLPPSVTIGAPPGDGVTPQPTGSRTAKAVCRIANAQISEITVTDGGKGYTTAPCVQFSNPSSGPATGTGAAASVALEAGSAGGNPDTGIVYWQIVQVPYYWWLCLADYQKVGNGYIVPATGGSGTGAKAIFYIDPAATSCVDPSATYDGTDMLTMGVKVEVWDFGTGYQPTDVVTATVRTASNYDNGNYLGQYGPRCSPNNPQNTALCQLVAKGFMFNTAGAPDRITISQASPSRQRRINPTPANAGSGYRTPPSFTTEDGDIIRSEINCAGQITKLILDNPNKLYLFPPKLIDPNGDVGKATALAITRPTFRGKYQCYLRFVNDSVSVNSGGPLYSSLSPVNEVDCGDGASKLTWSEVTVPTGATSVELWRSSADQAITLFRVAKIGAASDAFGSWVDKLSDYDLTNPDREGFLAMPILLSDGSLNANRFGIAPGTFAVGVVYQDRTFLAVDTTGEKPNTILYSEADEPESVPDVNELILQTNVRDTDYITALIPYAGALLVAQTRHCNRLTFVSDPGNDAQTSLIAYRGCLNQRCWDIYQGTAYLLDENGLYSISDGGQVEHLSFAVDSLFRENTDPGLPQIDFAKRKWFFVRSDRVLGLIRVHVAYTGDDGIYPTRQLVYDPDTKAWWTESYPTTFSAATEIRDDNGRIALVHAGDGALYRLGTGLTDDGAPVSYSFKTGNIPFITDAVKGGGTANNRNVSVVYKPTAEPCNLNLSLFYNGSKEPRANVIRRDRGVGFIHDDETPSAYVDLSSRPHEDAESHGIARALFLGRTLEDIYGTDTHLAVQLHGQQTSAGPVILYSVELEGVEESS